MNNRSDNQKVEARQGTERERGWGRKVWGDDSAWGLYLMRRFHLKKKVSQLIIARAYISDCYSSVVSTSRQLIKAFPFSLLYTWTLLHSSWGFITCCNHFSQAKWVYFHLITCSYLQCGLSSCSVSGRILSLYQNSDRNIGNIKRFTCENKPLPRGGNRKLAHSATHTPSAMRKHEEEEAILSLDSLSKSRKEEEEYPVQSVQHHYFV